MSTSNTPHLILSQLNGQISDALSGRFRVPVWVVAEIAQLNDHPSGHVYLDLVEKRGGETLAKARAQIWRSRRQVVTRFEQETRKFLSAGMEVLLQVQVRFHPVHGLSLDVQDINAGYTIGDMARRRQEVVERLYKEKLIERNRSLPFPLVPQRVAVVSSPSAAGYTDFHVQLRQNARRYDFAITLFPAAMQGEEAEASVLAALEEVRSAQGAGACFDVVAVIRGGGAALDLTCFDGYELAKALAEFPLPVVTAIGHEKDGTVADLVAGVRAATPTAAAHFLIQRCREFEEEVERLAGESCAGAAGLLRQRAAEIDRAAARFSTGALKRIGGEKDVLSLLLQRLARSATNELHAGATDLDAGAASLLHRLRRGRKGRP